MAIWNWPWRTPPEQPVQEITVQEEAFEIKKQPTTFISANSIKNFIAKMV